MPEPRESERRRFHYGQWGPRDFRIIDSLTGRRLAVCVSVEDADIVAGALNRDAESK